MAFFVFFKTLKKNHGDKVHVIVKFANLLFVVVNNNKQV